MVSGLYQSKEHFDNIFCPAGLEAFWQGVHKDDPKLQMLFKESSIGINDLKTAIPCWLHGDAVEYTDSHSLVVYSWGSALNGGPSLDSSLLLAALPKDICAQETWDHFWAHIVPAFQELQCGEREGQDIAGGYKFILWSLIGDQEHYSNSMHLPHWANAQPCFECKQFKAECMECLASPIPAEKMRTLEEEHNCRLSHHPLFTLAGFSHFNVCQDAMHILYCKGVLSHCMGNALKHWCWHSKGLQGTPKARLATIFGKIQQYYKEYNITNCLNTLKLSMFVDTERPHQERPFMRLKAGECRGLVPIFAALAVDFSDGTDIDLKVIGLFQSMASFQDLMDIAGRHPTKNEADAALELYMDSLDHYQWLQLNRVNDHQWHSTPKFHNGKHLAMSLAFDNPTFTWAFRAEDFVGRMAKLGHSVSFGTRVLSLSVKITEKYRLMMFCRFWKGLV